MDILFVTVFSMGVPGVAWATLICQSISCILSIVLVLKKVIRIPSEAFSVFSLNTLKKFTVIAVPSMLQQLFISIGNIMIQGIINPYGSGVTAGYSAAVKLNNLVITSFTTIGNGISNFSAQNMGAGYAIRVRQGYHAGLKMVWLFSVSLTILYFFGGQLLIRLFLESATAYETGILFLKNLVSLLSGRFHEAGFRWGSSWLRQDAGIYDLYLLRSDSACFTCLSPFPTARKHRNLAGMASRMDCGHGIILSF